MSHVLGGKVERADVREYGKTEVIIDKKDSKVFLRVFQRQQHVWMSHFDYISKIAPGFEITAHTADCPVAAAENATEKLYAIQFHPEVLHTVEGTKMINNFVKNVCECAGDWKMDAFVRINCRDPREGWKRKSIARTVGWGLTLQWQQDFFPKPLENSLLVYS